MNITISINFCWVITPIYSTLLPLHRIFTSNILKNRTRWVLSLFTHITYIYILCRMVNKSQHNHQILIHYQHSWGSHSLVYHENMGS